MPLWVHNYKKSLDLGQDFFFFYTFSYINIAVRPLKFAFFSLTL